MNGPMRLIWMFILMLPLWVAAGVPVEHVRKFQIRENDSSTYTLNLALDEGGRPLYFYRNIYTPVCNTGECKPVYINFYWDLLGNYTRFDMPEGEVLTKTDHRDFKLHEYEKLQEILARQTSILAELKMEDLVVKGTEKISDSVDIKTGATLKTIKNEVIEGAVYTCFTLWHLAHGKVGEEIRRITETYTSPALLHSFLQSNNHYYQYWAMEKVMDAQGRVKNAYEEDVAGVIRGKNIFTARFALQKVHRSYFTPARQEWLWNTYATAVYPLQMAILKRMKELPLSDAVAAKIAATITEGNREQLTAKLALLAAQPKVSSKVQQQLAVQLDNTEGTAAADIYAALQKMHITDKSVQQKLVQYEKKNNQTEN